jgi:hypothetical protein
VSLESLTFYVKINNTASLMSNAIKGEKKFVLNLVFTDFF